MTKVVRCDCGRQVDAPSFTVDGPVQAEILVVVLDRDQPALTGP